MNRKFSALLSLPAFCCILWINACTPKTFAPSPSSDLPYVVKVSIDRAFSDNLDNIYILTTNDRIQRYDSNFNLKYEYANRLSGDITSIDITNPQKILAFVKNFNKIIILDNTLAEVESIDLNASSYLEVSAAARSNDDNIWIFDVVRQALVKIDRNLQAVYFSNRMSDYGYDFLQASIIKEKSNQVFVNDPNIGILVFDNFGKYQKLIPEKGIEQFIVNGNQIFFYQNQNHYKYDIRSYTKETVSIPFPDIKGYIKAGSGNIYFDQFGILKYSNQ